MAGRDTAPLGVSNSTKQQLRPNTTLLKDFLNYNDCSCALGGTNGRRHSFVLDLFFVILPDYLFPSSEKEKRSECRYNSFTFSVLLAWTKRTKSSSAAADRGPGRPTHMDSHQDCKYILLSNWWIEPVGSCSFETHGGAVPMACSILIEKNFRRPSGRR